MQGLPFCPTHQCHVVEGWPIEPDIVLISVLNCKEAREYGNLISYDMEITLAITMHWPTVNKKIAAAVKPYLSKGCLPVNNSSITTPKL
jgi:hypothetical protein